VRRIIPFVVVGLVAAGCRDVSAVRPLALGPGLGLRILETPTPFDQVAAGPVRAIIPDRWRPVLAGAHAAHHAGFMASPRPRKWASMDGSVAGMSAVWIDVAEIGVPSDWYYVAATGPALSRLTGSDGCRAGNSHVFADHRPTFFRGPEGSPGDYVATGQGTCRAGEASTRWAYFIAAPGYGPIRTVGIPSSGLYVVVAVLPESRDVERRLRTLLRGATFGGAGVRDFIDAVAA
jgi:hypothetical protein